MSLSGPNRNPTDCEPTYDEIQQIQLDRLQRVRNELKKRDYAACVLFDPTHMRYATGSRNMQVYSARNPARYAFIPAEGRSWSSNSAVVCTCRTAQHRRRSAPGQSHLLLLLRQLPQ